MASDPGHRAYETWYRVRVTTSVSSWRAEESRACSSSMPNRRSVSRTLADSRPARMPLASARCCCPHLLRHRPTVGIPRWGVHSWSRAYSYLGASCRARPFSGVLSGS